MKPVILNQSEGGWVFAELAEILSRSLWVDISKEPADLNYLLTVDSQSIEIDTINSFIPIGAIQIASDKREIERCWQVDNVTRPVSLIIESRSTIAETLADRADCRWILKYPTGCGGMNHRIIDNIDNIPTQWPQPFLIQEFIESIQPAVYRFYCVDRELFGFNVRKFTDPTVSTPWVSHANGARYFYDEIPSQAAIEVARTALMATGLYDSFGVVDLVKDARNRWYALEVGTDGIYNFVDRDFDNPALLDELNRRLAIAFWRKIGTPPWGKNWHYRD